jgi:hypothetical protein
MSGTIRENRKIKIELNGDFDGWWAEMRLHVPFKLALMLEAEDAEDRVNAIRGLIIAHNFKSEVGFDDVLEDPTDAPDDAIDQLLRKWGEIKAALPSA